MPTKFFESVGTKLGEQWAAALVTPAAMFWAAGLGAWAWSDGWNESGDRLAHWFSHLSGVEQGVAILGVGAGLIASAAVGDRLAYPTLRTLEGYWPFLWLRQTVARFYSEKWFDRRDKQFQVVSRAIEKLAGAGTGLTDRERRRLARLRQKQVRLQIYLARVPNLRDNQMPTRVGNILRSSELRPLERYGLDAVVVWPRLWLLLPGEARTELNAARQSLDSAAVFVLWAALLAVWGVFSLWMIPVAVLVAAIGCWWLVNQAENFADLVEATFDLHRWLLYEQLRLPLPMRPSVEVRAGRDLTDYLQRGTPPPVGGFTHDGRSARR